MGKLSRDGLKMNNLLAFSRMEPAPTYSVHSVLTKFNRVLPD